MQNMRNSMIAPNIQKTFWNAPVRFMHWLTAGSLLGATILTTHGNISHTAYGIIVLAALLAQLIGFRRKFTLNPVLWLVTAVVVVLNLSGWLVPEGNFHLVSSLIAMLLAALYSATVLFESMQRISLESA